MIRIYTEVICNKIIHSLARARYSGLIDDSGKEVMRGAFMDFLGSILLTLLPNPS